MKHKSLITMLLVVVLLFTSLPLYAEDTTVQTDSSELFFKLYSRFGTIVSDMNMLLDAYDIFKSLKGTGLVAELESLVDADTRVLLISYGLTRTMIESNMDYFFDMIPDVNNSDSNHVLVRMIKSVRDNNELNYFDYASDLKDLARDMYSKLPGEIKDEINAIDANNQGEVVIFSKLLSTVIDDKIGSARRNTITNEYSDRKFEIKASTKNKLLAELGAISNDTYPEKVNDLAEVFFEMANVMVQSVEATLKDKGEFDTAFDLALAVNLIDVTTFTPDTGGGDTGGGDTGGDTGGGAIGGGGGAVVAPQASINLNVSEVSLETGSEAVTTSFQLEAEVFNSTANVVYTSSDETIVTVTEDGLLEAVGFGNAVVTASLEGTAASDTVNVVVFLVGSEESPLGAVSFVQPYISGYPDGSFRPDYSITRAEVAQIFTRVLNLQAPENVTTVFSDLSEEHWGRDAILKVAAQGLVKGYPDGSFKPDQKITRAEIMSMFSNYWKNAGIEVDDSSNHYIADVNQTHWAMRMINQAYNVGLVNGYGDRTFKPDQFTTRAEMVIMVNKLLGREDVVVETSTFDDVASNHWAKNAIEAAATLQVEKN